MVQVHVAHHRAHAGDRQLHDAAHQIIHLVNSLYGIGNLPVNDRVNVNGDVVSSDDGLRRQIEILLAQIDRRQTGTRVGPIDRPWPVEKWHQNVEPAVGQFVELAKTFNEHDGSLGNDSDRLDGDHQHRADSDDYKQREKYRDDWLHKWAPIYN